MLNLVARVDPPSWQTLAPMAAVDSSLSLGATRIATVAGRVGDPDATRTVYTSVVVLVVLGVVLAMLALWVFRRTRPEAELLAPLEQMDTRRWRRLDPAAQRRSLDEARPDDASPLRREASAPAIDSSFAVVAPVASFDDLVDDDAPFDSDTSQVVGEHERAATHERGDVTDPIVDPGDDPIVRNDTNETAEVAVSVEVESTTGAEASSSEDDNGDNGNENEVDDEIAVENNGPDGDENGPDNMEHRDSSRSGRT